MDLTFLALWLFGFVSAACAVSWWSARHSRNKTRRAFNRTKQTFAEVKTGLREIDDELRYLRNKQHSQAGFQQMESKLAEVIALLLSEKMVSRKAAQAVRHG